MGSPPGFGRRGTYSSWFRLLQEVDAIGGYRRSVTRGALFDWVGTQLDQPGNPFAEPLRRWGLLDTEPLVYVNRPSADALAELSESKATRLEAQGKALQAQLGASTVQDALAAFKAQYDADTEALEASYVQPTMSFLSSPPMGLDEPLHSSSGEILGVPLFSGHFSSMSGAELDLALSLRGLTDDQGRWLGVLPDLLTDVGVVLEGAPVAHGEVTERLQREVLGVSVFIVSNARTGRLELVAEASGTDATEFERGIFWARAFLEGPDWRPENLPRIRDVVQARLTSLRGRMLGREESWVQNPPQAWRYGNQPQQLRAWSFLTQAHDVLRIKWRLAEPGSDDARAVITDLAEAGPTLERDGLMDLLAVLQGREGEPPLSANRILRRFERLSEQEAVGVVDLAADLERILADIPDETLAKDLAYLGARLVADWGEPPADALVELTGVREALLVRGGARLVATGGSVLEDIETRVKPLIDALRPAELTDRYPQGENRLIARLVARGGAMDAPHVGLRDPNRRSGVHVNAEPFVGLSAEQDSAVVDHLTANAFAGGGAHTLFMRTWGAGLAYSNGVRPDVRAERILYYAERCPSLGQTMDFVIDVIQNGTIDPDIAEYAVAQSFGSRAASGYEDRAFAMAADIVDGMGPETVRQFRQRVLSQRSRPELVELMQARLLPVHDGVLPGLVKGAQSTSFVIGDDAQLEDWAAWLVARGEPEVERLYPRDFWLPAPL